MDESCPCHCHAAQCRPAAVLDWPRILALVDAVRSAARLRMAVGAFVGSLGQNKYHSVRKPGQRFGRKSEHFPLPSDM
jgi:hypothetical protein